VLLPISHLSQPEQRPTHCTDAPTTPPPSAPPPPSPHPPPLTHPALAGDGAGQIHPPNCSLARRDSDDDLASACLCSRTADQIEHASLIAPSRHRRG
uniref:Uncharacterized protein n=1 Tax=Triticum urartu TaxID=4572 RepID=A0A8R7UIZ1_TRIUA